MLFLCSAVWGRGNRRCQTLAHFCLFIGSSCWQGAKLSLKWLHLSLDFSVSLTSGPGGCLIPWQKEPAYPAEHTHYPSWRWWEIGTDFSLLLLISASVHWFWYAYSSLFYLSFLLHWMSCRLLKASDIRCQLPYVNSFYNCVCVYDWYKYCFQHSFQMNFLFFKTFYNCLKLYHILACFIFFPEISHCISLFLEFVTLPYSHFSTSSIILSTKFLFPLPEIYFLESFLFNANPELCKGVVLRFHWLFYQVRLTVSWIPYLLSLCTFLYCWRISCSHLEKGLMKNESFESLHVYVCL